jgi:hypothetical protein
MELPFAGEVCALSSFPPLRPFAFTYNGRRSRLNQGRAELRDALLRRGLDSGGTICKRTMGGPGAQLKADHQNDVVGGEPLPQKLSRSR